MTSENIDLEAGQAPQEVQPTLESPTTSTDTSDVPKPLWKNILEFVSGIILLPLGLIALIVLVAVFILTCIVLALPVGLAILVKYLIEKPPQVLLDQFPLVLYIPAPDPVNLPLAELPSPSSATRWEDNWVESDLPYVVLEQNNAGCLICMMDFDEPRRKNPVEEVGNNRDSISQQIEMSPISQEAPEPLRQLPCNHVFHKNCVDPWILNESTKCPYCRKEFSNLPSWLRSFLSFFDLDDESSRETDAT